MSEPRTGALGATAYVLAARALRASARIVIVFLLARFYTQLDVATFAYAFVAASLIGVVCDLGLTDFAVREIATASSPDAVTLAALKLRCTAVLVAIGASTAVIVATSSTPPLVGLAIAAYATALGVSDLLGAIHRAYGRYPRDAFEAAVPVLALIAAGACAALRTSSVVFFAVLGVVALVGVGIRVVIAFMRARGEPSRRISLATILRASRWFAVRAIVATAMFEIAVVILQQLSSTAQIAAYAVAQRPVGLMNQSLAVVAFVFLPTLSRTFSRDPSRLGAAALEVNLVYLVLVPAAFAACVLGGDIFVAMSGESYANSVALVRLLAIATLLYNGTLTTAPLLAAHHERIVVVSSVVGLALLAGVGIALVPAHGADGAALATGIAFGGSKLVHIVGYRVARLPLGDQRHLVALVAAVGFIALTAVAGRATYPLLVGGALVSAFVTARLLSRARLAM